jgi:hypothetical protein
MTTPSARIVLFTLVACPALAAYPALAGADPPPPGDLADDAHVDRVPDNPAIALLGAEDLKVVEPGSVKDLDVELRELYKDGKIVPEIAIELSPWGLTAGRGSTYEDYLGHWATRLLRRFTVSIATTSVGSDDAQTTLGAIGLRLRLIDDADWRLNRKAVQCALEAQHLPSPPDTPPPPPPDSGENLVPVPLPADTKAAIEKCFTDNPPPWNATQLSIGAALSSAFPGSKLRWDLDNAALWLSYFRALGTGSGMTLGAKYLYNDVNTIDAMTRPTRQTIAANGSFELRDKKFGLVASLGIGHRWTRTDMGSWDTQNVGLLGGEVQFLITTDTWLSLRFSAQLTGSDSELISLVNVKWNYDVTPKRN